MHPSIGPAACCIPAPEPGGIVPLVPGIINGRGPIDIPIGNGCGPGTHSVIGPLGMQTVTVPGITGTGPRGGLMFDVADAENGDIGGMSVTAAPAEIRPAPVAEPLLALGGISSKLLHETGINGAADVSLTGLNMSATSDSFYAPPTTTTTSQS